MQIHFKVTLTVTSEDILSRTFLNGVCHKNNCYQKMGNCINTSDINRVLSYLKRMENISLEQWFPRSWELVPLSLKVLGHFPFLSFITKQVEKYLYM